jgi:hypothetical protein
MNEYSPMQIDRRTAFKWVLAAAAALQMPESLAAEMEKVVSATGYGKDPDLLKVYAPGELWPLTLTAAQRSSATVLADAILPADGEWPAASKLGVVEFIDEWISAPYSQMTADRSMIVQGLEWLDADAKRRFRKRFAQLASDQISTVCDELAPGPKQRKDAEEATGFFARFRQLVAAGYYTTPQGMRDIGYVGNVPLAKYDGPPQEVLRKIGVIR